ncbi:UDP-N-acetylmuramoyl-tripeptide--D-alanyl-D-alanine ligase [hydrothermal vent metagenome]|uniref:UDP-MurNAc-pentapeptide synthetase n=1 Tax=hydrothermal vent metagenome TaxID=652676 RepID=A0A3B1BBJ9_9ZZZZ
MISFSLSETAEMLGGCLHGADVRFASVSTDSRTISNGDLFVALQGPNFDGHDWLDQVLVKGAVGAMVSRDVVSALPRLQVTDTRQGLGALAACWREASLVNLVAVTGSNGKTTVKEMIAAILSRQGQTLATIGNLNNDIGLPLTLLRLQDESYAVVEMGAGGPGEIEYLSGIARPDVAILNNAGAAHLEGFGSPEGVARAKAEIVSGLAPGGTFIFNADEPWADLWHELAGDHPVRTFGMQAQADVTSSGSEVETRWDESGFLSHFQVCTPEGDLAIKLPLAGSHNQMNALAAIAATQLMGASLEQICDGLASMQPVKGRLQPRAGANGVRLIDDSYNANPDSVAAAIAVLATAPGCRFMVLGDLAELGEDSENLHEMLGRKVREAGIEQLYCLSDASCATARGFGVGAMLFREQDALIAALQENLSAGDSVLIKGSRSAGMEQVVCALLDSDGHC